jgi:hypothetical protein
LRDRYHEMPVWDDRCPSGHSFYGWAQRTSCYANRGG